MSITLIARLLKKLNYINRRGCKKFTVEFAKN